MKKEMIITIIVAVLVVAGTVVYSKHASKQEDSAANTLSSGEVAQNSEEETASQTEVSAKTSTNMTNAEGLKVTTTKEGTGEPAKEGDAVSVNYTGMLTNGTVFDSNVDPKFGHVEPFEFTLGENRVIAGWEQGVLGMKAGEKRHLVIPSELGYGDRGAGALIPPNATLEFDVEAVSITRAR